MAVAATSERDLVRVGRRAIPATWAALGLYAVLAVVLFGGPIVLHPTSHILAFDDQDPSFLIWMLAWWPHALLHGLNPFITHAIFYPDGYNLAWSTSMPLPALVLAPLTLLFGPSVSWNVLALACPALSAFTAFLLCRSLTAPTPGAATRPWPALAGGFVFGFSPYVAFNIQNAPNIGFVALLPVFVLLVLRHVRGELGGRRFTVLMALALSAQFLISNEILATSTMFGAAALVAVFGLLPQWRRALVATVGRLALAYAATAVLISPYLYYMISGRHYPPGITNFAADLAAFVLPPPSGVALRLPGHALAGSDLIAYLGLPLVALIVAFLWQARPRRLGAMLAVCLLVPGVLSLGGYGLHIGGHQYDVWLPWQEVGRLPLLHYAIPSRFTAFVFLPAAVIVSLWLTGAGRGSLLGERGRWALAGLAVLAIVPQIGSQGWNTAIRDPSFFTAGTYRRFLDSRDHVMTLPAWGPSQRWVADAGFPFSLVTGSAGQGLPPSFLRYPIWKAMMLFGHAVPPHPAAALRRFLADKRVTAIVMQQGYPGPWQGLFAQLGLRPVSAGGVVVYRVSPAA